MTITRVTNFRWRFSLWFHYWDFTPNLIVSIVTIPRKFGFGLWLSLSIVIVFRIFNLIYKKLIMTVLGVFGIFAFNYNTDCDCTWRFAFPKCDYASTNCDCNGVLLLPIIHLLSILDNVISLRENTRIRNMLDPYPYFAMPITLSNNS